MTSIAAAVEAHRRGYTPVPLIGNSKKPYGSGWTHLRWESEEQVRASFEKWHADGVTNLGLHVGEASNGLVDVDLDHHAVLRLRSWFLPPTEMESGRPGNPRSHRWYQVDGPLPATRRYKMPDGSVSIELRSGTGLQTMIPPSIHDKTGELVTWEGEPWGGSAGPAKADGRKLAVQVALTALGAILIDGWPQRGSRHDAYLALAGGLLRFGESVHPYWERNLPVLIEALAEVTHDDDDGRTRVAETMATTLTRIREGDQAVGFPRLGEIIGVDHAEAARRMAREVETLSGFTPDALRSHPSTEVEASGADEPLVSTLAPEERNPMEERITSWDAVDLEPYLSGQIVMQEPTVLRREDGKGLFYPGRVNSLFGMSESAKSWIAMKACTQEMGRGDRVLYLDFEDEPAGTIARMRALGAGDDDIQNLFRYVHPEGPIAAMQRYRFGQSTTEEGEKAASVFTALLESFDPTLIVADGMTVIYGLHGHDTNEATGTDVITSWLKSLCRGGRSTVVVIDHTGKSGGAGSSPIGAHHKIAMVQGTALRADAIKRPMPGEVGTINLVVFKDRPGAVRSISSKGGSEQVAAEVEMDSTEPGVTRMTLKVPEEGNIVIGDSPEMEAELARLARVEEDAARVLELFGGDLSLRLRTPEVSEKLGLSGDNVRSIWKKLRTEGRVVQEGTTRWTVFRLRDPREKGEDDDE